MCSLMMGLMAATTGLQMYAQNKQAHAERDALRAQQEAAQQQYNLQIQQAKQNQAIQEHKSETDAEDYAIKQKQANDKHRQIVGQILAAGGSSNVSTDSGSIADSLTATDEAHQEDSRNLLRKQKENAYSNYIQWANYKNDEYAAIANQTNANNYYNQMIANNKSQYGINTFGTILSGVTSIYGQGVKEGAWGKKTTSTNNQYNLLKNYNATNPYGFKL